MTKSKIIGSALLLALAATTSAATIDNDDEMAKIALSVSNILNHHDKPAATPITKPVAQPTAQPATKKITQDDFDKLVDELAKKVPTPQAAKPVENKTKSANLDKVVQADIDKIVAKVNEKNAKNAAAHTENKTVADKQAKFDQLFEELRAKLKAAHGDKTATPAKPTTTVSDKYDQIVAKIANKNNHVETVSKKSPFETEREQMFHELREKLTRAHSGQATFIPKTEVHAQVGFSKPVGIIGEKKADEKTSIACLLSHAGATSTIRKIADASNTAFTVTAVRNVKDLLEELAGKVEKINNNCEAKFKVNFTQADINSTCQKDFQMTTTLAKIFKNTHPGSIQRVITTSTEMMVVRNQMKKNC